MSGEDILRSDRTDPTIDPSSTVEALKEGLSSATSKLQEAATRKGHALKSQGKDLIDQQKEEVADRICSIGCSVKRAADKLREADDTMLADTAEGLARRIEDAASYVRERPIGIMLKDAEDFTKRHSTWVLGGLFLGGIALARFLKASRPALDPDTEPLEGGMLFEEQDEGTDLEGNIYEDPRFEETPLGEARFGGVEAEGFGKSSPAMPESDIGARDRSEVGVNVGRTQSPPPNLETSSSSGHEPRPGEPRNDLDSSGRKI